MKKIFSLFAAVLFAGSMMAASITCAEAAAAAKSGSTDQVTVRGYVTSIKTAWSSKYQNISFWMADTKDGGEVIQAFRAACASEADAPQVGDLVEVTGALTMYNTTPELDAGCTFEIIEKGQGGEEEITTCAAAAEAALAGNTSEVTLQGYVTEIATAWSSQYKNISFWIADTKDGGKVLQAYRAKCETAEDAPGIGDKVEVKGKLTKYNSTPELAQGCTFEIIERDEPAKNLGEKTIAEFLELKNVKDTCVLTGVVANIVMDKDDATQYSVYGNFDLVDENDPEVKVYIYGLLTADGKSKQFREMDIDEGDVLTLKAVYGEHNGEPQAPNAIYVSHEKKDPTAISNTAVEVKAQKVIRDGQIYIVKDGQMFNLVGASVK